MDDLSRAAFGDDPGRWPLPAATTPLQAWHRAVAAGGQGRYASGFAHLDSVGRAPGAPSVASLALSTRASFLRQLGRHVDARPWDGRALALAGTDAEARADALIGLAADALGVGRFGASARLLQRAREVVGDSSQGRLPVRLGWVSAELAMFTGDGETALGHAERAVELAASTGSVRHAVKSDAVLAAALCSAGDPDASRRVADTALAVTQRLGLVPLSWALACLLLDVGSAVHTPDRIVVIRDESADAVRRRGGVWAGR
ncbi:MAG: tetratricopeptide repeat protein [Mycobacterium sp.]|nr:tetratricopeptide repeat protein [Mycobacterium sp.]